MVLRLYVEKKPEFAQEAEALLHELRAFRGIKSLSSLRILNRYDAEGISEEIFNACRDTVFSEPPADNVFTELPAGADFTLAVEALPGQFDQRADSAAQCVQLSFACERPTVRAAKVYLLYGDLSENDLAQIKQSVINPVESREAALEKPDTLIDLHKAPEDVKTLSGFRTASPAGIRKEYALAMDESDVRFCQCYFDKEGRDPTLSELRVLDTYWSDHCRHTTFLTEITDVSFDHPQAQAEYEKYLALREKLNIKKPVTLMNLAVIGAKALKAEGKLTDLDESEEINACTVKITADEDGRSEPWLLLFKNETHNHPTEIEPFGGAATCIGGAIRDPLSGRAYVYQAMRVTGAADPTRPLSETLPGKLPQRKLVRTAAQGYSAYGNQIGLATPIVEEFYHPGYAAKHLELGAVTGAVPARQVRREAPLSGDIVLLVGGRTGRDGCGGATGSSKSHTLSSLTLCGAEVQKGNAPEERKLQRLLLNPDAAKLIKRCNDFGAGGVAVAVGELADGLDIDLSAVPRKYDGLDGTELAISESQERMAMVVSENDKDAFISLARAENLECTPVAVVTESPRMVMRWRGKEVVNLSRELLSSNGASRQTRAHVAAPKEIQPAPAIEFALKRGLSERFDATIGPGTVLMPFGGKEQLTPAQAAVSLLPTKKGDTKTCSCMAAGFDPYLCESDPFKGAYMAVVESLSRLCATGLGTENAHLTFQEYFERMTDDASWGKPLAALLGALKAQLDLSVASVGGKDSMSGSFEALRVPPTLVSFAVGCGDAGHVISPELKRANSNICLLAPRYDAYGLPVPESLLDNFALLTKAIRDGRVLSAWAVGADGTLGGLEKMALGNRLGFDIQCDQPAAALYGAFLLETADVIGEKLGIVTDGARKLSGKSLPAPDFSQLDGVYPVDAPAGESKPAPLSFPAPAAPRKGRAFARPRALIPVFPGTNCELDSARAFLRAGAEPEIFVVRNLTAQGVRDSMDAFARALENAQILFLPGGFSGGDEPDGSAKFICAFLRGATVRTQVEALLQRDGLVGGVCNGFQALIKLGLAPFGRYLEPNESAPTLTFNRIGRHQSRLVRARACSLHSPWMTGYEVGESYLVPISHGEGRLVIDDTLYASLAASGQIAFQYADESGAPSMDITSNPAGSYQAVEGLLSPDGRVLGRMAHAERCGKYLYRNVPGRQDGAMFKAAVAYFK